MNSYVMEKVRYLSGGPMTISVSQKDENCFQPNSGYGYSFTRLMLLRIIQRDTLSFECCAAVNDTGRDLHLEIPNIEPGEYYIFAELDWSLISAESPKFQITAYGNSKTNFLGDEHNLLSKEELLCSIMRTKVIQGHQSVSVKNMANSHLVQKFKDFSGEEGYCFIYFSNLEEYATYKETCKFTLFEGLRLLPPHFGSSYEVVVPPQSEAFVLIQIVDQGWTMKSSFKYTLQ